MFVCGLLTRCSNIIEASPMLSLDINLLVLFIEVACTANQVKTPIGVPSDR